MHVPVGPAADQSVEVAELTRQIGSIDVDITLMNERLDTSQGMCLVSHLHRKILRWHMLI